MSAEERSDSDMGGKKPEASAACINNNIKSSTPSDVPESSVSKKARLKKAMRKLAIENELDASDERTTSTEMIKDNYSPPDEGGDDVATQMETPTISNTMNSTEASKDQSVKNESKTKSPEKKTEKKLAPAPPRWRFVNEAKSTLGYSSRNAGVFVSGRSSTELGAEYTAPEITKDVKVRTIEHFVLVAPDEKELEPQKEEEVGQFTIREWDKKTEGFDGDGGLHHDIERSSLPTPDSKRWKPTFAPTPGVPPYARKDGGESFGYDHDPTPVPKDPPQFDHRPPGDDTPIETNRVVGKLKFSPRDDNDEEFNGEIPKRNLFSAKNDEDATSRRGKGLDPSSLRTTSNSPDDNSLSDNDNEVMENIKPTHLYLDSSMATTGVATSDGGGSSGDNHSETNDHFEDEDLDESDKPISLRSIHDRQRKWKRYRWLLLPLLIVAIIIGAVVGKKRSSEGMETALIVTEGFVFGVNDTSWPSQSPTVFLNSADTNADPLFSRPTFSPTYQPSLIPSITPLPSASPSILPSTAPSGEPSSNPTAKPSITPSSHPTLVPSTSPTSDPSILPSNSPSASATQLPSESGSPTVMGSVVPNPTAKPSTTPPSDSTLVLSTSPTSDPSILPSNSPSAATQLFSESGSPTIMGSVVPSFSLEPSPSPSQRPSKYPSNHPITTSPSKQPITFMGGCPEPFEPFTQYINGTEVSRDGVIYMCISTNCGSLTYAPGGLSDQWRETWAIVGSCNGTNSPTLSPTQRPSITPTENPSITMTPTRQPIIFIGGCTGAFDPFGSYDIGSIVSFEGIVYECILPVCGSLGLAPEAWKVVGSCNGTIAPTSKPSAVPSIMPTPAPLAPTMLPTKEPSVVPTMLPSKEPSLSPTKMPTLKPVVVPTPMPTCPPQNGDFNLCIALDMSGSVCGGGECLLCQPMSSCNSFGINQQRCCNNFDNVLEFSKALVRALGDLKTQQDFSLIHFATDAEIASTLQNANQAIKTLQQLAYTGGRTHLGAGITMCQQTLNSSTAGRKNLMLVVTDGYPSRPDPDPRGVATQAATDAKNKGTHIIPIFIERAGSNDEAVKLMKEISSDAEVFLTDFDSIVSLKDIIFEQVICHT